jgi:hypothetical protein
LPNDRQVSPEEGQ